MLSSLVQSMNQHGIARMCRLLAVVQPALSSLGAAGAAFRPESARAFEKARAYYSLLTLPADGLIKAAAEKPKRFTSAEYMALLQVCIHPFVYTLLGQMLCCNMNPEKQTHGQAASYSLCQAGSGRSSTCLRERSQA